MDEKNKDVQMQEEKEPKSGKTTRRVLTGVALLLALGLWSLFQQRLFLQTKTLK